MRATEGTATFVGWLMIIIAGICVCAGVLTTIPRYVIESPEAAAWVQAIGSIAAIAIAIGIFAKQNSDQQMNKADAFRDQQNKSLLQLQLLILQTEFVLSTLHEQLKTKLQHEYFYLDHPALDDVRTLLNSIPVTDLDEFSMQRVFTLRRILSDVFLRYSPLSGAGITYKWSDDRLWIANKTHDVRQLLVESSAVLNKRGIKQPEQ